MNLNLSIIIPVGPGRDAHAALTSLQEAGLEEGDEVIVIGDGHTPVVPEESRALPLRVESVEPGSGANAARNKGAGLASNDYFCFLDDDDAYEVGVLSILRAGLLEVTEARAWSLGWRFRSGRSSRSHERSGLLTEADLRKRNFAGGCSSMVLTREAFEGVGGFDPEMPAMQDWDLWLRVACNRPIRVLSDVFVVYEDSAGGRISTDAARRIAGFTRLLQKHGKTWSAGEVSFHEARLAALSYSAGKGDFCEIFKWRVPLASLFFMWQAMIKKRGS